MKESSVDVLGTEGRPSDAVTLAQKLSFFCLTVLGFSFWFFIAVPFASHREAYDWLTQVSTLPFSHAFSNISTTYRPPAQAATWLGYMFLDPSVFPTSVLRQALLQSSIYGMFVFCWWLIYRTAVEPRLFALVAFVAGGVFFSGYVNLFHISGIMYVAVLLMIGVLLRFQVSATHQNRERLVALIAVLLSLWHPFATVLFVGFYFGFYLDTFRQRGKRQHIQAVAILLIGIMTIAAVAISARPVAPISLHDRLFGMLVSYQTNEVNRFASLIAFVLTQMVFLSLALSPRLKLTALLCVSALSAVFLVEGLPILILWLCAVLLKLFLARCWRLFFLTFTAALLPFLGSIGAPVYALFAIILAVYATPLGWARAERALAVVKSQYVMAAVIVMATVVVLVRMGIEVPVVTKAAHPLLMERERTYQLEKVLAWLHNSPYSGYEIGFAAGAGDPTRSVENVITRKNRPPASLSHVRKFWDGVLRRQDGQHPNNEDQTVIVTFGGPQLPGSKCVFKVEGKYAGEAQVWIGSHQE